MLKWRLSCLRLKHKKYHNWESIIKLIKINQHNQKQKKVLVVEEEANPVKVKKIQVKKTNLKMNKCKMNKITSMRCKINNNLNNKMSKMTKLWMMSKLICKKLTLKNKRKICWNIWNKKMILMMMTLTRMMKICRLFPGLCLSLEPIIKQKGKKGKKVDC